MVSALARELRENCAYLEDEGWHYTAQLMELAADEIDRMAIEIAHLRRLDQPINIESYSRRRQLGTKARSILARIFVDRRDPQ
jgi:hypothetical protein